MQMSEDNDEYKHLGLHALGEKKTTLLNLTEQWHMQGRS